MSRPHTITPVVSVVMPTYNGERFLRPAIESILNQTFQDFELIVVDDSSTDSTPHILSEVQDDRLVILKNERNLGIAGATNIGLAAAHGEYIALQDHDDISLPHRLQTEVDFLNSHPEIALVGSAATLMDENGLTYEDFPFPTEEIDLKWKLLWDCSFHHTAIMVRRAVILGIGGYGEDPAFRFAECYDPLSRLSMRHGIANLPDRLVLWRRHPGQTSMRHQQQQMSAAELISFRSVCALIDAECGIRSADGSVSRDATVSGVSWSNVDERAVKNDEWLRYLGARAFLFTPGGELPALPAGQVTSGLRFLREIQSAFYQMHAFPRFAVLRHCRHMNWIWGKHAIALAFRAPWDWRSSARMLMLGVRLLQSAGWTAFCWDIEQRKFWS